MSTLIEDLEKKVSDDGLDNGLDDGLDESRLTDFSVPIDKRMEILERAEDYVEHVNRICALFRFSKIHSVFEYMFRIAQSDRMSFFMKWSCIKELCDYEKTSRDGFHHLRDLCCSDADAPTPCRVEALKLLLTSPDHRGLAIRLFCEFVVRQDIECDYRYKTILSLEEDEALHAILLHFIDAEPHPRYVILAGQYFLQRFGDHADVIAKLTAIATSGEYNARADAADVLLNLAEDQQVKDHALAVLTELGRGDGPTTIWTNNQNVHDATIEESVMDIVNWLQAWQPPHVVSHERIVEELTELKDQDIDDAINRIAMDRKLYGATHVTLKTVLQKVWMYIEQHTFKDEMRKRLLEELREAKGTCSSGFISRLANSITGFGEFSLTVSWDKQMQAQFAGKFNSYVMEMEACDAILEEMTIATYRWSERPNLLALFRTFLPRLRQEFYEEYKDYMTDTDFDLYFRKAISAWEGCF